MKKFVFGFIFGLGISFGVVVQAEEIKNFMGKTISGQFVITVNGEQIKEPGIVVDGVSYLPTRTIAELAGFEVYFDADLGISLNKKVESLVELDQSHLEKNKQLTKRLSDVMAEIEQIGTAKLRLEEEIHRIKTTHATMNQDTSELEQQVRNYDQQLNELYDEKAALEAQLNAQ